MTKPGGLSIVVSLQWLSWNVRAPAVCPPTGPVPLAGVAGRLSTDDGEERMEKGMIACAGAAAGSAAAVLGRGSGNRGECRIGLAAFIPKHAAKAGEIFAMIRK